MARSETKIKHYSFEEYIALEQGGEIRYEYHSGEVFAMAGGTISHAKISYNVGRRLGNSIEASGKNCTTFGSDAKIEVVTAHRYLYPDVSVVCGKINDSPVYPGAIRNPRVVVEVMSPSSAVYDMGAKMRYYFSIKTVKEYLIINQATASVSLYRRHGDGDLFAHVFAEGLAAEIELESIGVTLQLADIYQGIEEIG